MVWEFAVFRTPVEKIKDFTSVAVAGSWDRSMIWVPPPFSVTT
jgi:hypothetical protein